MKNNREILEKLERYAGEGKLVNILLASKDEQHDQDVVEFLSNLPKDRYNVSCAALPEFFYSESGIEALLRIGNSARGIQLIMLDNIKTYLGIC